MSQYLLSVWHDDEYDIDFESEDMRRVVAQVGAFNNEVQEAGAWVFGGGLLPASSAAVVRDEAGELLTTDGPYPETKEQIGGFWVIEAPDSETAMEWAGKAAVACEGPVEVRPFQDG